MNCTTGFALFKSKEKKLLKGDGMSDKVETAEGINGLYVRGSYDRFNHRGVQIAN